VKRILSEKHIAVFNGTEIDSIDIDRTTNCKKLVSLSGQTFDFDEAFWCTQVGVD
jgi:hypothetical protein